MVRIKFINTHIALWKVVINLPESLKKELLNYAEYLREQYPNNQQFTEKMETIRGYGSWAGQIIMSDDFDEPLEDLAEYISTIINCYHFFLNFTIKKPSICSL